MAAGHMTSQLLFGQRASGPGPVTAISEPSSTLSPDELTQCLNQVLFDLEHRPQKAGSGWFDDMTDACQQLTLVARSMGGQGAFALADLRGDGLIIYRCANGAELTSACEQASTRPQLLTSIQQVLKHERQAVPSGDYDC
jgi:hypothetical protein